MSRSSLAKLICCLLLAVASGGCDSASPTVSSDDTKVLAKLGSEAVAEVVLSKPVSGVDEQAFNADFDKIMARDATVHEKIKACRETPQWLPAELVLITPVVIANLEQEFGPAGKKVKKHNVSLQKEIEFATYGNLEVGLDGSKVVLIMLNQ